MAWRSHFLRCYFASKSFCWDNAQESWRAVFRAAWLEGTEQEFLMFICGWVFFTSCEWVCSWKNGDRNAIQGVICFVWIYVVCYPSLWFVKSNATTAVDYNYLTIDCNTKLLLFISTYMDWNDSSCTPILNPNNFEYSTCLLKYGWMPNL